MSNFILVPTDFSKYARYALDYAIVLAKKQKADIILLHAFSITYISPEVPMNIIAEQMAAVKGTAEKRLKVLAAKIRSRKIGCEIINEQRTLVSLISDVIQKRVPSLIVMGTKGASGLKEVILGSNASSVIKKVKCPVVVVPKKVLLESVKHIVYATDYHAGDIKAVKKLVAMSKLFNANITVIHVPEKSFIPEKEEKKLDLYKKKIKEKVKYNKMEFRLMYGPDPVSVFEDYVRQESPDLFVMSAYHRSLPERLFKPGTIKKMVCQTKIPILVLH